YDFISSLRLEDEYFVMTFDDRILVKKDLNSPASPREFHLDSLRYGESTRMYDAIVQAIGLLSHAHYERRALFVISDGQNTSGSAGLREAIRMAQQAKLLVYSL